MKLRKVCSRAGSDTLRMNRSMYAVVVITSSSVNYKRLGFIKASVTLFTPEAEKKTCRSLTLCNAGAKTGTRNPL